MITLLVLNYLTRVQREYYFFSFANIYVVEKNGMISFFSLRQNGWYQKTIDNSKLL